jgi:hypothetical protein
MFFPRQIDPKIAKYINEQTNAWLQKQKQIKQPMVHNSSLSLLPFVSLLSFTIGFYFAKNISSSSL